MVDTEGDHPSLDDKNIEYRLGNILNAKYKSPLFFAEGLLCTSYAIIQFGCKF